MAHLAESLATLRLFGDDLVPGEVTALLGAEPTRCQTKGDRIVGNKTGNVRIAKCGSWLLHSKDRKPEDIDGQVSELLGRLTGDLDIWRRLSARFEIDLFCGLFMKGTNEGFAISPSTLVALGQRGIKLQLDVYAPCGEQ